MSARYRGPRPRVSSPEELGIQAKCASVSLFVIVIVIVVGCWMLGLDVFIPRWKWCAGLPSQCGEGRYG